MLELQNLETLARSAGVIIGPKTKGRKQDETNAKSFVGDCFRSKVTSKISRTQPTFRCLNTD